MNYWLIATDEAGYGPKLGPLVVAATLWKVTADSVVADDFATLARPLVLGKLSLRIADSKRVFKPHAAGAIDSLRYIAWSALRCSGFAGWSFRDALSQIAECDIAAIEQSPWLATLDDVLDDEARAVVEQIVTVWKTAFVQLAGLSLRVITAKQFNAICDSGLNKSDLLSSATLGLVDRLRRRCLDQSHHLDVYCDRHGGRRYYAGVLQHQFPELDLRVMQETAARSSYTLTAPAATMQIRFTVKGDSFTPVALSSMIAKYTRELAMNSLNRYFIERIGMSLKPTAGYPVDADRFLNEITTLSVDRDSLVRKR